MCDKYNGWTNYETWNCKLWIDNDEVSNIYWEENAQEAYSEAEKDENFTRREKAILALSKRLQAEHEENTPTVTGFYADILNAALSSVNWYEIAESLMENIEEEESAEV